MVTTTGPTRMLTGIQESDLGSYRCDVTNDAGTGSANINIEIGGIHMYVCIMFRVVKIHSSTGMWSMAT